MWLKDRDGDFDLPEAALYDLETSWRVWTLLEATGWKFLPSELLGQPDWLMSDLMEISTIASILQEKDRA